MSDRLVSGTLRCGGAIIGSLLLLMQPCSADPSASRYLIAMDGAERLTVQAFESDQISVDDQQQGLVLWSDGDREYWQLFSGKWVRPNRASTSAQIVRPESSRGGVPQSAAGSSLSQNTTLLAQVAITTVFRGSGSVVTPHQGAILLNPRITFRREGPKDKEDLPPAEGVLRRRRDEVLRIHFEQNETKLRWNDLQNLPDELKSGLPAGSYQFELSTPTGVERVRFLVHGDQRRNDLLRHANNLSRLLKQPTHPLVVQVAVEKLLAPRTPHLVDALDSLEQIPESQRTAHLAKLLKHVRARMKDPGQLPAAVAPGRPTGIATIDDVRAKIAGAKWDDAIEQLDAIEVDDTPAGRRTEGLAQLYRGVILSESGPGRASEAVDCFRQAIHQLATLPNSDDDLYRAHNNAANFLLGQAQDRLHNHSFQIAAGVQRPFTAALESWVAARRHYDEARRLGRRPDQRVAVKINLACLYGLLADMIRTLGNPEDPSQQFPAAEQAGSDRARLLVTEALAENEDAVEPQIRATAEELLAQLHLRKHDLPAAVSHAAAALNLYQQAGSLTGIESSHRLLGLCKRGGVATDNSQNALWHFSISQQLAEVLRDQYPAENCGLSRAGFLARRAYVNEQIVNLLIEQGDATQALRYAELSKARSLENLLATRGISTARGSQPAFDDILANWPDDVAAVEYFLGVERGWVFVVDPGGKVTSHPLAGKPHELVADVNRFLSGLNGTVANLRRGQAYGDWQAPLHRFYQRLVPPAAADAARKAKTLVIVPHHVLHYFPFAALVVKPDLEQHRPHSVPLAKFLVDEPFDTCTTPSLTTWAALRNRGQQPIGRVNGVGIVHFQNANSLPGAREDIKNLRDVFQDHVEQVFFGDEAQESAVKKLLVQPGLLFFATHGQNVADRPLSSRMLFLRDAGNDGDLTAEEIFRSKVGAQMVVMSACQTGLADRSPLPGDDLFGLQRAFLQAGANTVVAGLWNVYDDTGALIMHELFRHLRRGTTAAAAMSHAQRTFLKEQRSEGTGNPWLHPFFWAVYNVNGSDKTSCAFNVDPESRPAH